MTDKQIEKEIKELRKFGEELKKDPARIRDFLYRTGMYTRAGRIKPQFR